MPKRREDGQKREVRVDIFMAPSEFEAIDDWRFKNRIGSRGEAIRQLITAGLAAKAEGRDQ